MSNKSLITFYGCIVIPEEYVTINLWLQQFVYGQLIVTLSTKLYINVNCLLVAFNLN